LEIAESGNRNLRFPAASFEPEAAAGNFEGEEISD